MNNISIYLSMLNLPVINEPKPLSLSNKLTCCGEVEVNKPKGEYSCIRCGLVKEPYFIVQEEEPHYPAYNSHWGTKSAYSYSKPRFYNPLTHFREHVRRYVGARFTDIPEALIKDLEELKITVLSPDAFNIVKEALKSLAGKIYTRDIYNPQTKFTKTTHQRSNQFYKDIFNIIYLLGGIQPKFTQFDEIYQKYRELVYYFERTKTSLKRHNMPTNYMLLDILLQELGHTPYYKLPYLKNQELQNKVLQIFKQLRNDQEISRHLEVKM